MNYKFKKSLFFCFTFLIYLFIANSIQAQSGWFQIPPVNFNALWSINFPVADTGYMSGDNGTLLRTFNSGNNWSSIDVGLGSLHSVYFINAKTGYVVHNRTSDYKIYKTTNNGNNWTEQISNAATLMSIYFVNSNTGYVCGDNGRIIKTTNGGTNWNILTTGTTVWLYSIYFINSNTGLAAGYHGKMLRTTNAGVTWDSIQSVTSETLYSNFFFLNVNTGYIGGGETILMTSNSGINWTTQLSLVNARFSGIFFTSPDTGFAVGDWNNNGKIYKTDNAGNNWILQTIPAVHSIESVYFINSQTGFTAGYSGEILKTTTGGLIVNTKKINQNTPEKYFMYQNYPNPFNPLTNIKFDIPKSSHLKIIIYNALGKEVSTLVNEKLNAGSYEAEWSASGYPNGVYFYKLIADDFIDVKKMLLIK